MKEDKALYAAMMFLLLLFAMMFRDTASKRNSMVECSKTPNAAICLVALK